MTIRPCSDADFDVMHAVINAAATAYAGVIPGDRYRVPYMSADDVTLIRHAFRRAGGAEKDLLRRPRRLPERQVETSVVLRQESAASG